MDDQSRSNRVSPRDETRQWKCDLHTHTLYSRDSLTSLNSYLAAVRRKGLDRVAVTDHNSIAAALQLKQMDPERIIVGEEIRTSSGELIAYFIQEEIPPDLSPEETIERVRAQGGVVGVSHPLDDMRREAMGEASLQEILGLVDFLETLNARCFFSRYNHAAQDLAQERGILATAGSDAHTTYELGRAVTLMHPFDDPASFIQSLRSARVKGRVSPFWVHFFSKFASIARRTGLIPLPLAAQ